MRTLFFCARDIRDYLKGVIYTDELDNTPNFDPRFPALTDAPAIQDFLLDLMKVYFCRDEGCNAPVCSKTDVKGLRLDFNFGLRLEVPKGNFHVTISDKDSGIIFFDRDISDVRLISVEKHFLRWQVEIRRNGRKIFSHMFNPKGKKVLVAFNEKIGIGDILAMLPFAQEFAEVFNCRVSIYLPEYLREIAANFYPALKQVDKMTFDSYATYFPLMYGGDFPYCGVDFRNEPLEKMASEIFGIDTLPPKPTFKPTEPRQIAEPYVCIGVQASTNRKCWLWPGGWDIVVDYLKRLGYRVLCIDKNAQETNNGLTIRKPEGAEDFTGNLPLMQRANLLYHAEFFIGLGSGLSWLANAVGCPVVMICGFSQDWFEFYTPYRVANRLVCNGCFNDVRVNFMGGVCYHHQGTAREMECQKKISPQQVISAIERLIRQVRH